MWGDVRGQVSFYGSACHWGGNEKVDSRVRFRRHDQIECAAGAACRRVSRMSVAALLAVGLLTGCGSREATPPDRIIQETHASGDEQTAGYGEELTRPVRVQVQGPRVPGMLGGEGTRKPVRDHPVTFRIMNPESGAVFASTGETTATAMTGPDGIAGALPVTGQTPGDLYIEATTETVDGEDRVSFRVIVGVEVFGDDTEAPTGSMLPEFGVVLHNPDGTPASGVEVHFSAIDSSVGEPVVVTDAAGAALTSWSLGDSPQQYHAYVEIVDRREDIPEAWRFDVRSINFEVAALDKQAMTLTLFGGLAVFIFGMKLMSGGLQRMADRRLKSILQAMTRNTVMAVGVGAGLTALVQSSSATTVMTVGFINAGLLSLQQAIGVVFGANIGTTITAQMIAFDLSALSYPAIVAGLILTSVSRQPWLRHMGEAILGFGLLFLGMTTMSDVLKPLRHSPDFIEWFSAFDCTPVDGVVPWRPAVMCIVVGTIVTVIVQSSSASIGLVLALSGQGLISFYTAFPLILGDNIGTTITALLASLGANRNAKRAALAHMMFNVFGALYMYALLFVPLWNGEPLFLGAMNAITPGNAFAETPENLPRHVANAHSTFNIFNCLIFIPLVGAMAAFCRKVIPLTAADRETVLDYLEPHLLRNPSLALDLAIKEVSYMLRRAQKSINDSCDYFFGGPESLAAKVAEREDIIDRLQSEITSYLVQLSEQDLDPDESRLIPLLIHVVNDIERIGDRSENLIELTQIRRQENLPFSDTALSDIRKVQDLINGQCHAIYEILENFDIAPMAAMQVREDEIDREIERASDEHVERLEKGGCDVRSGVVFLDYLSNLERVGDHLMNVGERAVKVVPFAAR